LARQINDVLELEREIDNYRDTLNLVKSELRRIRMEFLDGALSLSERAIGEIDEELETITLTVENVLF
jgi:hypothetical protein